MRWLQALGGLLLLGACSSGEYTSGGATGGMAGASSALGGNSGEPSSGGKHTDGSGGLASGGGITSAGGMGGATSGGSGDGGGATSAGGSGGAGGGAQVACGTAGLTCDAGSLCVESTIYPNNVDPAHTYPPSTSWQCKTNPCGDAPLSCDCARTACGYPECSVAANKLVCVFRAVCASPETLIATPRGERRIADLRIGDLVFSADRGALRAVPVIQATRTPVAHHHVIELRTADGSVMEISPGHPTADGRFFGELRAGDLLDGAVIVSSRLVDYRFAYTYDILPASDTGTYVAFGKLIGSTLK